MLLISNGESPEFVTVTSWGGYGPSGLGLPKVTVSGVNLAAGAAADTRLGTATATKIAAVATIDLIGFTRRHLNRGPAAMRVLALSGFPLAMG